MRHASLAFLAFVLALPGCGGGGGGGGGGAVPCSTASQDRPEDAALVAAWDAVKTAGLAQLRTAAGWGCPERLPGAVNTLGWEDSAFIAPDGSFHFAYLNCDLLRWSQDPGGAATFPRYQRGPLRGLVQPPYLFEVLSSSAEGNAFCSPSPFPYAQSAVGQGGPHLGSDGAWYYAQSDPAAPVWQVDIYRNGAFLAAVNTPDYDEDDPHHVTTAYGTELFFASGNRPGAPGGGIDIWVASEVGGVWQPPVALVGPVNLANLRDAQPHFRADGALYFSSDREVLDAIWVSQRTGANAWAVPQKIIWADANTNVAAVGEPTLTADGTRLYCIVVFVNGAGEFDADVVRFRLGPCP